MRKRPRPLVAVVLTALVATLLTVIPPAGSDGRASAANAADFDPGFLVSDEQFYDGHAMSTAEVQAFIDRMHPGCTAGYTCLDTYAQRTSTMPADAYCDRVPGRSSESAASIIARVGEACDISQRYLLVLLQKEQSLVTHRSPNATRYAKATGFGCPDTAPCDPSVGGFYYQIYFAARQFQRYKAHPENWAHRAGVRNWVWWHPNQACGYSPIFIRNAATAGLYNYTPYRPNQAALDNLYGTGDSCSSYGNRNTWRMWTDWFGDPTLTLPSAKRVAGANRYETAIAVSRSEFSAGVPVVYLASGQNFPDGLSAGPAAAHQGGPVLLTPRASVPKSVLDEITRLRPQRVVIVGDRHSVSAEVEAAVRGLWGSRGPLAAETTRVEDAPAATETEAAPTPTAEPAPTGAAEPAPTEAAEPTPQATAEPVPTQTAESMPAETAEPVPTATAAPTATAEPTPSPTTTAEPESLASDQPASVEQPQASAQATSTSRVLRLGGANRYETSRLIAEHAFGSAASAFVATGVRFPDALAAGPAAALRNGPVLLVRSSGSGLDSATRGTLQRLGVRWVGVVGDTASVSASVAQGIAATGAQVVRYAGANRYATSVRLASLFGEVDTAYVVSGQDFPDALAGAAAAGAQGAPMLLTQRTCMPAEVRSALIGAMPDEVLVLGGPPTIFTASARYTSCR